MTDNRGTFRLRDVRKKVLNEEYVPLPSIWLTDDNIGNFRDSGNTELITTNIGTEITNSNPSIDSIPKFCTGISDKTHALFAGGSPADQTSTTPKSDFWKLTYSTYTAEKIPAQLPIGRTMGVGVAGEEKGYISQGYHAGGAPGGGPAGLSDTCKITFSTDTVTSLPSANLDAMNWQMQSLTDGAGGGYLFGGTWVPTSANNGSRCYKITYSTDGLALLPGSYTVWNTLETNRNPECSRASMMNRTAGYQSGGDSFPGSDGSSMTTKLTYSSMAWSVVPGAYLPNPREKAASGTGSRQSKGWYGCGQNSGNHSNFTLLDFSSETWTAAPGMAIPAGSSRGQNSDDSSTSMGDNLSGGSVFDERYNGPRSERWVDGVRATYKDYYYGGGTLGPWSSSAKSKYYKIAYSTDTHSSIGNSNFERDNQAAQGNASFSWVTGGYDYPETSSGFSQTTKFTYGTDIITELPSSNMTQPRGNHAPLSDHTYMWVAGGRNSGQSRTDFEKATFSVGTWAALPGSNLNYPGSPGSTGLRCTQSGGNQTTGYFLGGAMYSPPNYSNCQKIVYSSGTVSMLPGQTLTYAMRQGASASSETALYVIQGEPNSTSKNPKMVYSTETVSEPTSSPSSTGTGYLCGTGNSVYGRKINAHTDSSDTTTNWKLDYTVDTWSSASNSLSGVRDAIMFTSESVAGTAISGPPTPTVPEKVIVTETPAPDVGYFTGGPHYSSTDKLNFTNDTRSAGANMGELRYNHVCWGNGTNFLDAGGTIAYGGDRDSKIEKITLSNDTQGALPGANMPNKKRFFIGATGTNTIGYIAGGQTPSSPGSSSILKVTYASYTTDANPGCHLNASAYTAGAGGHGIGSPSAAYICAGMPSGTLGEGWHKIPYSTNTATYSVVGSFNNPGSGRADDQSTGNKDKGYVTGYNPGSFSTSKTTEVVFATDTASNSTYSPNLGFSLNKGATGNQTTGYFHGGLPAPAGGAGNGSYITKFVYASDTISQLPASGKMSVPRTHCDAGSGVENSHNMTGATALI